MIQICHNKQFCNLRLVTRNKPRTRDTTYTKLNATELGRITSWIYLRQISTITIY